LQVSAEGGTMSGLTLTATSNSTLTVTYETLGPRARDTMDVSITIDNIHIAGSPFTINVATRCGVGQVHTPPPRLSLPSTHPAANPALESMFIDC